MRRLWFGPAAFVGGFFVFLGISAASAGGLELAAGGDAHTAGAFEAELERAGFYAVTTRVDDDDRFAEAIADFEHYIGWPETGEASPAILSALRAYNARADETRVDF